MRFSEFRFRLYPATSVSDVCKIKPRTCGKQINKQFFEKLYREIKNVSLQLRAVFATLITAVIGHFYTGDIQKVNFM